MEYLVSITWGFWEVLSEMSPYLIFGFLVAGILSIFISQEVIERHLGGNRRWAVFKAAILGVPLPLCSCGVIPVAASLRRHGAGKAATSSFLLSTPQTGVDSILVTYSLLGPVFAIFRPIAALLTGIFGGGIVSVLDPENGSASIPGATECSDGCCGPGNGGGRLIEALRFGFITLPQDIGRALMIGIALAGIISVLIPADFFADLIQNDFLTMVIMMVMGIPIYVCATASVPVAAALILKGISPGAALVFLLTGPATNAATITMVWKLLGRKTTIIYLSIVCISALASGLLINYFFEHTQVPVLNIHLHPELGLMKQLSAVALLLILGFAWVSGNRKEPSGVPAAPEDTVITLHINGMTCNHCVNSVKKSLREISNVNAVEVLLKPGSATVSGKNLKAEPLIHVVSELGYAAEEQLT